MSKVRVQPTARDLAILADLASWGVLSLEQIRRRHFAGLAQSVSSERIAKLHDSGLVCKQRVGILMHHGHPKEIGSVVTLTRAGHALVHFGGHGLQSPRWPKRLNTAELYHDLLLVEVADQLKAKQPGCHVVRSERAISSSLAGLRVPDLVVTVAGTRWAVELELTVKSSARYRQILASYQVQNDYKRVLYVVGSAATAVKIRRLLGEHLAPEASAFGSLGVFTFRSLEEFLGDQAKANSKVTNTQTQILGGENQ